MKALTAIILSFFSLVLWGASEQYVIGINGEELQNVWDETEDYALIRLGDPLAHAMPGDAESQIRMNLDESHLSVKLWYEDALMAYHSLSWTITVNYYIELVDAETGDVEILNEFLTIDYSPYGVYSDIQLRDYPGYISAILTLDNIEVTTDIPGFQIPKDVRLDLVLEADRHYALQPATTGFTVMTPANTDDAVDYIATYMDGSLETVSSGVKGLPIMWEHIAEANSYDLEWLFVDCLHGQSHDPDPDFPPFNPEIDFRNATRVNVNTNYYEIPMGYPEGYLIVRVRPVSVSMEDMTSRTEGEWTLGNDEVATLADALLLAGGDSPVIFAVDGVEAGMNWQYTAGFAEDGKRKESLTFFDGALRSRQGMTFLNTEDKAVVAESHYDFQGRSAFQVLPSPLTNQGLQFYANLNGDYDKHNFDVDYYSTPALTASGDEQGGHRYFSADNTDLNGTHEAYVPDAEGYPFARSIYTNDGTNRLAEQSSPGQAHNEDHTQKIYYTVPTQAELDRLFGSNAGIAKHYQKIVSKDANGQHTVAYLDQEGRTIATALLGGNFAETNLMDLDGRPEVTNLTTDLLTNNEAVQDASQNYLEASSTFSVPMPDTRTFSYNITPEAFISCAGDPLYCEYDLSIKVYNQFGELEMDFELVDTDMGASPLVNPITPDNYTDFNVSWTIPFEPGTYQIVKKLTLDESSIQSAHNALLEELGAFNPVVVPFTEGDPVSLFADETFQLDFGINDEPTVPLSYTAATDLVTNHAIKVASINPADDPFCVNFNYDIPLCDCDDVVDIDPDETCDPDPFETPNCYDIYWKMIADLSPGGQYFDNLPARFINEFGVLVENDNYESEKDNWLIEQTEPDYLYGVLPNDDGSVEQACWSGFGIDEDQPVEGISACNIDIMDIYRELAMVDDGEELDWETIRTRWQTEWNEEWPALQGLTFDPDYGYLPFDEDGLYTDEVEAQLRALDDLFHLHPEAMSYENVCDIRAYEDYISVDGRCKSNFSLPDAESIDFLNLLKTTTSEDFTEIDGEDEGILTAIDLGLFYAPFDFYDGANFYYPTCSASGVPVYIDLTCPTIDLATYHIQNVGDDEPSFAELGNYISMSFTEFDDYGSVSWTNEVKDPMGCEERALLVDHLMNFMPLANGTDYMSIYAVMDDPLGVAVWTDGAYESYEPNSYIGEDQIAAIRAIHDLFRQGLSKWDFFKSNYLFFREKVNRKTAFHVSGRVNDDNSIPTVWDAADYDGHTTENSFIHPGDASGILSGGTPILYGQAGGYWLYFPYDPIYDMEGDQLPDEGSELADGFSESCETECAIRVSFVLQDLQDWIAENGLDPMTEEQYNELEADLVHICEDGCGNSWSGMSNAEIEALDSYFDADIEYYEGANPDGIITTFDAEIGAANDGAWNDFIVEELDLTETASYDYAPQSMGDCSCRLFESYVYHNYEAVFGSALADDITEESFTLYDTETENVPGYIDLTDLLIHLNTEAQFMEEESYIAYPNITELEALIALCHSTDKDYCATSESPTTCYDALVTGTSEFEEGTPDYIYPLREAFLCEVNNPTMTEIAQVECLGLWELELENAMTAFHDQIEEVMADFYSNMLEVGMGVQETFTMYYGLDEFAYTLYYYDQAGNLVQTVPPAGVDILAYDEDNVLGDAIYTVQDVIAHREDEEQPFILPRHALKTQYKYNTLNNIRESETPDGGITHFFYDKLGRLIASQNARQEAESAGLYSYTLYDRLGRPYEAGEVEGVESVMTQVLAGEMDAEAFKDWVNNGDRKRDVVKTFYDDHIPLEEIAAVFGDRPRYIRNRIAGIIYYDYIELTPDFDYDNYTSGSFYSYDVNGNVNRLVQVNNNLKSLDQHLKTIDYSYDLVSGNVNEVIYQKDQWDQYHHRYEYDADNRLTYAFSSQDGRIWEKESRQYYYEHGPLARVEIGDKQVQAEDYAYTIQGWLKGVNSSTRRANRDIGKDGHNDSENLHAHFGKDAFGYHLSYYENDDYSDYTSIGVTPDEDYFLAAHGGSGESERRDLFNGNISMMVYTLSGDDVGVLSQTTATRFYYDQLNRIKGAKSFIASEADMVANNDLVYAAASPFYTSTYTYDFNGNITQLLRTGNDIGSLFMDALEYRYGFETDELGNEKLANNRLLHVNDALVADDAYEVDLDDQGVYTVGDEDSYNYVYDETGQLIKDKSEFIDEIEWTTSGKVKAIRRGSFGDEITDGNYPADLEFEYDPFGNRIVKIIKPRTETGIISAHENWSYTFYVRDAQGNPLTTYETSFEDADDVEFPSLITLSQEDVHVYGGERLGLKNVYRTVSNKARLYFDYYVTEYETNGTEPVVYIDELDTDLAYDPDQHTRRLGTGSYELTDHRGNVYNVVSDRKIADEFDGDLVLAYAADLQAATDYFPFGMPMPGRSFVDEGYRYGFNGKENDDEISGNGNSVSFEFRDYDTRVCRFKSKDLLSAMYSWQSPYTFAADNPILLVDVLGLGPGNGKVKLRKASRRHQDQTGRVKYRYDNKKSRRKGWIYAPEGSTVKTVSDQLETQDYSGLEFVNYTSGGTYLGSELYGNQNNLLVVGLSEASVTADKKKSSTKRLSAAITAKGNAFASWVERRSHFEFGYNKPFIVFGVKIANREGEGWTDGDPPFSQVTFTGEVSHISTQGIKNKYELGVTSTCETCEEWYGQYSSSAILKTGKLHKFGAGSIEASLKLKLKINSGVPLMFGIKGKGGVALGPWNVIYTNSGDLELSFKLGKKGKAIDLKGELSRDIYSSESFRIHD